MEQELNPSLEDQPYLEWPIKLTISMTHTCHNRCKPCYPGCRRAKDSRELSEADWDRVLNQLIANRLTGVFIEGGEPLLLDHIYRFVARASQYMMTWVRTHGDLVDDEAAAKLKAANVGSVVVDIWGASAGTHDDLKGRDGSFEAAVSGVQSLIRNDVPVIMTLIMTRQNIDELQDYLQLAEKLGAQSVGILRLYPLGHAREIWSELSLPLQDQMNALKRLDVPDGIRLMQSWHPNNGNCCWQSAAINAYGRSIGCVYLRDFVDFGSVLEQSFIETWQHPDYVALRATRVEKSCSDCSKSQNSHGGCRSTAFAFSGRWSAPDPYDEELNDGIDLTKLPSRLIA